MSLHSVSGHFRHFSKCSFVRQAMEAGVIGGVLTVEEEVVQIEAVVVSNGLVEVVGRELCVPTMDSEIEGASSISRHFTSPLVTFSIHSHPSSTRAYSPK